MSRKPKETKINDYSPRYFYGDDFESAVIGADMREPDGFTVQECADRLKQRIIDGDDGWSIVEIYEVRLLGRFTVDQTVTLNPVKE